MTQAQPPWMVRRRTLLLDRDIVGERLLGGLTLCLTALGALVVAMSLVCSTGGAW